MHSRDPVESVAVLQVVPGIRNVEELATETLITGGLRVYGPANVRSMCTGLSMMLA